MSKNWAVTVALLCLSTLTSQSFAQKPASIKKVTIAQFGHVFLYIPIYVALQYGYFKEQGLDVHLVSTGGDEKTFAAVSSGNAQFGVSDPTFVAIARERGQNGKVVAGIVNGTPFWIVTFNNKLSKITSPSEFANHRIATYTAPSTSYAVMKNILQNDGHPINAKIVQGSYGTLLPISFPQFTLPVILLTWLLSSSTEAKRIIPMLVWLVIFASFL